MVRHQAVLRAAARRRGRRARALGLAVLAGAAGAAVVVAAVALVRPDHERVDTGPVASYA